MEIDRNISILVFHTVSPVRDPYILDALCASGIRGIRYARELPVLGGLRPKVVLNDASPSSIDLARRNIQLNNMDDARIETVCRRAQTTMLCGHYDMIDIDPYGTSNPFLDAALQGIKHNGILALTYTDTATACGTYQKTCIRRYQSRGLRNHLRHEAGLRIIMGHSVRRAAEHDICLEPVLAYFSDHYFRIFVRVKKSRADAMKGLENMALGLYDKIKGDVEIVRWDPAMVFNHREWPEERTPFGPYWNGRLVEKNLPEKLLEKSEQHKQAMGKNKKTLQLLCDWLSEADMPPFFQDTDDMGRGTGMVPARDDTIRKLSDAGFKASRTHFSPNGIKTDASRCEIEEIISRSTPLRH